MLGDYLEDGLVELDDGVRLACEPNWEAANFEGQAHNLLKAARRLGDTVQVLKAAKGSTVINASGLSARGVRIETVEGGHLIPMETPTIVASWLGKAAENVGL